MEGPPEHEQGRRPPPAAGESVGDALRAAVERTLAATAAPATEARQRALGLVDDVVRRGQVARDEVTRRGDEATARLAEALGELRAADDEDRDALLERLANVERRLARLEAQTTASKPKVKPESNTIEGLGQRDSGS